MKYEILTAVPDEKEKMFIPGTIIWRANISVVASSRQARIEQSPSLIKTDQGNWMGRVNIGDNFIFDPCVSKARGGIVTFVDGEPLPDWTHLVVNHCVFSKDKRGGTIFAKFGEPMTKEDYLDFRQRMFDQSSKLLNCYDLEKIIDAARLHWPTIQTGLKRLITNYNYQTGLWNYVHIKY